MAEPVPVPVTIPHVLARRVAVRVCGRAGLVPMLSGPSGESGVSPPRPSPCDPPPPGPHGPPVLKVSSKSSFKSRGSATEGICSNPLARPIYANTTLSPLRSHGAHVVPPRCHPKGDHADRVGTRRALEAAVGHGADAAQPAAKTGRAFDLVLDVARRTDRGEEPGGPSGADGPPQEEPCRPKVNMRWGGGCREQAPPPP